MSAKPPIAPPPRVSLSPVDRIPGGAAVACPNCGPDEWRAPGPHRGATMVSSENPAERLVVGDYTCHACGFSRSRATMLFSSAPFSGDLPPGAHHPEAFWEFLIGELASPHYFTERPWRVDRISVGGRLVTDVHHVFVPRDIPRDKSAAYAARLLGEIRPYASRSVLAGQSSIWRVPARELPWFAGRAA